MGEQKLIHFRERNGGMRRERERALEGIEEESGLVKERRLERGIKRRLEKGRIRKTELERGG